MKPTLPSWICILCLIVVLPWFAARPQTPAPPAKIAPDRKTAAASPPQSTDYSKKAYVIQKLDIRYDFHADGTWEKTITAVVRLQSQAGIQAFGNLSMLYPAASQQAEFTYVRVRKPDGSIVLTPASNIQDGPAAVTVQAPMYSDLRLKQMPVANLNPGDTLEYQFHFIENHPEIPNQFWEELNFISDGIVLEEHVEIRVPAKKYVKVVSQKIQPTIHEDGQEKVYEWKTAHLIDTNADQSKTILTPAKPDIQLTTFQSWQQLGEWYRAVFSSQAVVTPAIRKQEQQITAGLTTDDAKQRAIYTYVATQFRYIGLSFGIGRLQPHAANTVLENKFGDCKDKHTLFAALMQAAGYPLWPAMIGSATKLDPDVPSPAQFDHVISVLPSGKNLIWLDTTEEVAPFGMLMSPLRDKQALLLPASGAPELKRTPAEPPFSELDNFVMTAKLDDKALLTGHASWTMRGDMELMLRAAFHATPRENWTQLGQKISYLYGFGGDVSNFQAGDPDNTSKPFQMSDDYTRKDYGGYDGRQITPPLPPVPFEMGENNKPPEDFIPLGAIGERDFRATVVLPKGDVATLVEDKSVQTDFAEYRETSSVKDGKLIAERFYKVKMSKLPASRWEEYLKFVKAVQARENLMVVLAASSANAPATAPPDNPEAQNLLRQAYQDLQDRRFNDAEDALRQVQAMNPNQFGLWGTYAVLDLMENKLQESIAAFHKEVENHPNNPIFYESYAKMLLAMRRVDDAIDVYRSLLKKNPEDAAANLSLGALLLRQKQYPEAVTLLKKAANAKDADPNARVVLGQAEIGSGQKKAGIADLETALHGAQKPIAINDASYELADNDADLNEAQQYAEKALQQMETAASKTTLAALTDDDLAKVMQLCATWDTVGWINFKQTQYAEAERYMRASWLVCQQGAVADHLGQAYQKEGKRTQAIHMYRLALAAGGLSDRDATRQRLDAVPGSNRGAVKKLSKGHYLVTSNTVGPEELGKLRTYAIPGVPKKSEYAEFFVLLNHQGVEDVQFIQGSDHLQSSSTALKKVNFDGMFPDSGAEKLTRRGILSCSADTAVCDFVLLLPQTARVK